MARTRRAPTPSHAAHPAGATTTSIHQPSLLPPEATDETPLSADREHAVAGFVVSAAPSVAALDDAAPDPITAPSPAVGFPATSGAAPPDDQSIRCCGMDEVGRGALAGPLVAAAVILPHDIVARLGPMARYLRDSKTVPPARRAEIAAQIRRHALALAIAVSPVETINARGVGWANRAAFRQLIAAIEADDYVVDGRVLPFTPPEYPERAGRIRCLVKADALVPAVSAASLVAKAYRDHLMATLGAAHSVYGWAENAGYGSPVHLAALRAHGSCSEHRTLFVATALSGGQRARKRQPLQQGTPTTQAQLPEA